MFRNRSYLGILKFGEEEFPGALPALVDAATFEAVQARVTQKAEGARRARRRDRSTCCPGWRRVSAAGP